MVMTSRSDFHLMGKHSIIYYHWVWKDIHAKIFS